MKTASLRPIARAFTLIELLVVLAIIGVLMGLLLPTMARVKTKARNTVCVSQLRQLGIGTRVFTDDHEGILPTAEILPSLPVNPAKPLPRICDVLGPYVGRNSNSTNVTSSVLKCPSDAVGRFLTEGSSYEWNTQLNGHRIDETTSSDLKFSFVWKGPTGEGHTNDTVHLLFEPTTTPLLLDYEEFHPRPPKSGRNVVYVDGHVGIFELVPSLP